MSNPIEEVKKKLPPYVIPDGTNPASRAAAETEQTWQQISSDTMIALKDFPTLINEDPMTRGTLKAGICTQLEDIFRSKPRETSALFAAGSETQTRDLLLRVLEVAARINTPDIDGLFFNPVVLDESSDAHKKVKTVVELLGPQEEVPFSLVQLGKHDYTIDSLGVILQETFIKNGESSHTGLSVVSTSSQ